MDQDFTPPMPPDFESERPPSKPQGDRPVTTPGPQGDRPTTAFHEEIYNYHQGSDTQVPTGDAAGRVSDRVAFRQQADQNRQAIIQDLEGAKRAMLQTNEIVRQGGGPYASGDGQRAYLQALEQGMAGYARAQQRADQLLYEVDPQTGAPRVNEFNEPVPSAYHRQLRTEYSQLQRELRDMSGQPDSPEKRRVMQEKMQQAEDIRDLTRMSSYARANKGLALHFGCAHLRGEDKINQRTAADLTIVDAATFDASMRADRNFMRHYVRAKQVSEAADAGPARPQGPVRPGDQPPGPVRPGDQPPGPVRPGDQPPGPVRPGDQPPGPVRPGDQPPGPRPGDQPPGPRPGDKPPAPPQPEVGPINDGRQFRDGNYTLPNGRTVLRPAVDAQNRPLATDNQPIMDNAGVWRTGADGMPVRPKLDGRDPGLIIQQVLQALAGTADQRLTDAHRTQFRDSITAADDLNRQTIHARLQENIQKLQAKPAAAQWLDTYERTKAVSLQRQEAARTEVGRLAGQLNPQQGAAFTAMWEGVTDPAQLDAWLNNAANAQHKAILEAHPNWAGIKAKFGEFLAANPARSAELQALDRQLAGNPQLSRDVNEARTIIGESTQLGELYLSSVNNRIQYLDVLMRQPEVQQFMQLPAAQKATSPLKDNVDVKEAQQLLTKLAELDRNMLANNPQGQAFMARAAALGVSFDRTTTPAPGGDRPAQPGGDRPAEKPPAPGQPMPITEAQETAIIRASQIRQQFITDTNGGQNKLPADKWATVKTQMEAAVNDASSITPESLNAVLGQAQMNLQAQLRQHLNMPTATAEQINTKQQELMTQYLRVNQDLAAAINALPDAKKTELQTLQQQFQTDMAAQRQAIMQRTNNNPTAADQTAFDTWLQTRNNQLTEAKKNLSPEMRTAMEAQAAFMAKPEGQLTAQFAQIAGTVEDLRHSGPIVGMYYAQMLAVQGEKEAAKTQLQQAAGNEQVRQLINGTQEGRALAMELGVTTPEMEALQRQAAADFPELVKVDEAVRILNDQSKDKTQRYNEAMAKFQEAIDATKDRNPRQLREGANALKLQLETALKDVQEGRRTALTAEEQSLLRRMETMNKQAEHVALVRYQAALAASAHGYDNNDPAAKAKAIELLESIEKIDPETFVGSPEIQGALLQARRGKKIDPATARSEAFINAATGTIQAHGSGFADFFVPGASDMVNMASGNRAPSIPLVGPMLFGGGKEVQERTVNQLAQAYLANADATQAAVDQRVQHGRGVLREVGTDVAAVGAGLATRYGLSTFAPKLMQGPWYMKLGGMALQVGAAGLTKDLTADGTLGTGTDWLRGGGMYGGSLLLMRGMALDPSRQALSASTTGALETRFGMTAGSLNGATGRTFGESLLTHRGQLQQAVAAGGVAAPEAATLAGVDAALGSRGGRILSRLNPLNYNPLSAQTWSAEAAASALSRGEITVGQYFARQGAGRLYTVGGSAFAFGAGREGLYIATGQRQADGSEHTWNTALSSMGTSGLQTSLSTMIMLPLAGSFIRGIPRVGPAVLDGPANLMSNGLTRIGVPAVPTVGVAGGLSIQGLGNLALVGASPTLRGMQEYNQANQLSDAARLGREKAEQARQQAEEELRRQQGGAAPQPPQAQR